MDENRITAALLFIIAATFFGSIVAAVLGDWNPAFFGLAVCFLISRFAVWLDTK